MAEKKRNSYTGLKMFFALVVAIAAWIYVVYNYDPMTRVTYNDVPISFVGEDKLADKGYALSDINMDSIYVVLNQKRVDTVNIDSDDITVTADVSQADEGKNNIVLSIVGPDSTQIVDSGARSISVDVEKADRKEVDIIVSYMDSIDESAEPIATNLTSSRATVIGAESTIKSVDKAVAYIGYSETLGGSGVYTRELAAVDSTGRQIPHTVIYPGSVNFTAVAGVTKLVPLHLNVTDNSDDQYKRSYSAPTTILIKGSEAAVSKVSSIDAEEIDISYIYADMDIELRYELPEGIYLANSASGNILSVKLQEKKPEEEETSEEEDKKSDTTDNSVEHH